MIAETTPGSATSGGPAEAATNRPQPADQARLRPAQPARVAAQPPPPSPPPPPAARNPAAGATRPARKPATGSSSAKPRPAGALDDTDDFDDREDLPFGCPNCNAAMEPDDDLCNACGYHLILKKVIDMEGIHRADNATGFDRVVKRHLEESESTDGMLLWAKLGGLFFLVLVCFVCLGVWGLAIGAALVVGYFIYAARLKIQAEDNPNAHVERDPIAAMMWSSMLALQRLGGWRSPAPPFGKLRALTLRDASLSNDALGEIEDLAKFEALDLQGTGITDAGLAHLKGRKKLRFLVLKNTAVTRAGVERLQQSIPAAWIWF